MTDPQADLTERARLLIEEAVAAAKPLIVQNEMVLHWRVERQLRTRIAAFARSEREAAAAEARRADIAVLEKYYADILENEDWPGQETNSLGVLDCAINMLSDLPSPPAPQEGTR